MIRLQVLFVPFWTLSLSAFAHPGGLNGEGCHHNRKTGDYHCHRAGGGVTAATQDSAQPAYAVQPNAQNQQSAQRNLPPGCFVGPRGGTYTITKSGRKNYGGC
ncbi:MAG: YHYH domain-containing protein [Aquabacterium sp.]